MTPPFPILRYLTPDAASAPVEGFTLIDESIVQGLPHFIQLSGELRLAIVLPTGLIRPWLDADPTKVISSAGPETRPRAAAEDESYGTVTRPPARIVLMERGTCIAGAGLTAKRRITLPENGVAGARVEIMILDWDLRAGSLRGPGNFGSRIRLAWRAADAPVIHFSTPPVNPVLVKRLPPEHRMESLLGLRTNIRLERFVKVNKRFFE